MERITMLAGLDRSDDVIFDVVMVILGRLCFLLAFPLCSDRSDF